MINAICMNEISFENDVKKFKKSQGDNFESMRLYVPKKIQAI